MSFHKVIRISEDTTTLLRAPPMSRQIRFRHFRFFYPRHGSLSAISSGSDLPEVMGSACLF
jgi:hypothetical protein